jgi:excisionase family DNA binding protein
MTASGDEWLTIEDIYERLDKKVPRDTIRSWIRSKRLPAYKPARTILVKREDLEKFLRESRTVTDEGN